MGVNKIKKYNKIFISVVLVIISCIINIGVVSASSDILDDVINVETTKNYAEDTSYSLLRGNNLNLGTVKITKLSSNEIHIYGLTQCHHACDKVYLELYLERKVNGSYSTYKYWEFEDENVSNLTASIDVIVPSGYYYRVRGYHAAKDGSKESTTTLTSGILVR